jgi:predicted nucleic acid-binding protein
VPQIIIDTSMLVPRLDARDSLRQPALHLWSALEQGNWEVLVFDCVANETISVLCRRFTERQQYAEWPVAFTRFREFCSQHPLYWSSRRVESLFSTILELMEQHAGRLNFHDALIVLEARHLGIPYIASFDHDFDTIVGLQRIASPDALVRSPPPTG